MIKRCLTLVVLLTAFTSIQSKSLPSWVHKVEINGEDREIRLAYVFEDDNDWIRLHFGERGTRFFKSPYQFRIQGTKTGWNYTDNPYIDLIGLKYGRNQIDILPYNYDEQSMDSFIIYVRKPFYLSQWFIITIAIVFFLLPTPVFIFFLVRQKRNYDYDVRIARNLRLKQVETLTNRLNPHFMFNSMTTLQGLITKGEKHKSIEYIKNFARIIRLALGTIERNWIPISEELESLETYLKLESVRFEGKFSYEISYPEQSFHPSMPVPALILHPFVERLLIYGTSNEGAPGHLTINMHISPDDLFVIHIENDWAREISPRLKEPSFGEGGFADLSPIKERLDYFYRKKRPASIIEQQLQFQGTKTGHQTIIKLPILKISDMQPG